MELKHQVADVLNWLSQYGGWGLLVIAVILILVFYDKLERPIAKVYDLFSWSGARLRRRAIKADIQSNINSFSQSIDREVPNTMPYNMKLEFISEMDKAELLSDKNLVLVRIRDRRHDDKNIVHAMLTFCPIGVLPASRPYLGDSLSDAMDFTVTIKFLRKIGRQSALNYLHKEVIEPRTVAEPQVEKLCCIFDRLDEQGLFTKVVLRELKDFGMKVGGRYPTSVHKSETSQFVEFMDVIAQKAPGEDCDTEYQGNLISTGFVFVGTKEKIDSLVPYLRAIQYKKSMGIERIYVQARDRYMDTAERIAYLAEKQGFAKIIKKPVRYSATDSLGQRRAYILIEMQSIALAPFVSPEKGRLLED